MEGEGGTYNAAIWRDAREENEHAIYANVGCGAGVAHGQDVLSFGEQFVGEEVVA
jgi:hypothetical protein